MLGSAATFALIMLGLPLAAATPAPVQAPVASAVPLAAQPSVPSPAPPVTPPAVAPVPLASPTAAPSPSPAASESPLPSAPPSPAPAATPIASPAPLMLPPDAAPQIVDVHLNQNIIHSGDMISGTVTTSTNVASVEVRIASYSVNVPRTDFGQFTLSYQAPHIPWFARGNYTARVIARNTAGVATERDIPIVLQ